MIPSIQGLIIANINLLFENFVHIAYGCFWCYSERLGWASVFSDFFFSLNSNITWVHYAGDKNHCSYIVHHCSSIVHTLKNIKNRSYSTIHTFKNYFATVFSVFSFSNNKFNPNGPIILFFFSWTIQFIKASGNSSKVLAVKILFKKRKILIEILSSKTPWYIIKTKQKDKCKHILPNLTFQSSLYIAMF